MIQEALSCLVEEVNAYFRNKLKISEDKVLLSAIVNPDGTMAVREENKILITLINVEKETVVQNMPVPNTASPLNLNLYVLVSAYFGAANYPEALHFLSYMIGYLQQKNVFTRSNTPSMDSGIARIVFEMENITTEKLNNVWATLGAKYMPSVCYKMRMLTIDGLVVREFRPVVSGVKTQ
jgi:hypothetical protein